jgi:predicted RNA-binding Zn-ribbon protein involved in translation (DUF1610 family)
MIALDEVHFKKERKMKKSITPPRGGHEPKILLFDIETAPTLGYVWGLWDQNIGLNQIKSNWYVLCWAAKWLGEKKVMTASLPDFPIYKRQPENDRDVMKALWKLLDEADIVIGQNGDAFDIKKSNARFILHGMNPPSPYKTVDTLKVAKKYFKFESNKLDHLGEIFGLGKKLKTGGFDLWVEVMRGDMKAWKTMVDYNIGDVKLLEGVYLKMRPWMTNHPNFNLYQDTLYNCPNCGSQSVQKRGFSRTRTTYQRRYHCQGCGAWSSQPISGTGVIR